MPTNPTPEQIKAARQAAGLTQTQAGAIVHTTVRTWQQWEAGDRKMHPAFWELFRINAERQPVAWIARVFDDDEMVEQTVNFEPIPERRLASLRKEYRVELVPLYENIAANP